MEYKFFDKRYLVLPTDKDVIGKEVFYRDTLAGIINEVENGDVNSDRYGVLDDILIGNAHPFYIDDTYWGLVYYDPNYECKVAHSQGKQIQFWTQFGKWEDVEKPMWCEDAVYRVKPDAPAPKTRRYTNRELAKWCANNKGQYTAFAVKSYLGTAYQYPLGEDDEPVHECIRIREWDSDEWHEPLVEVTP